MKVSKFNHYYNCDGEIFIYNARTTALANIEKEKFEALSKFTSDNSTKLDNDFIKDLEFGGFILPKDVDELNILKEEVFRSRMNTDSFGLTIAPTLACNFKCPYCYEREVTDCSLMTEEVQEKIIEFIESKIPTINHLSISWYGGEPLLKKEIIENLSEKIIKLCEENNVSYYAGITTNGYFLNKDTLEMLHKNKVNSIQVPLDGMKDNHDETRFISKDKGSFDKIIENLMSVKDLYQDEKENYPRINIRVNITRKNHKDIYDLVDLFKEKGLNDYVGMYIAKIDDPLDKDHEYTLTNEEFIKLQNDFSKIIPKDKDEDVFWKYYPDRITASCCCDSVSAFVVDPKGILYKCWEEIGHEEYSLGDLINGRKKYYPKNYYKYLLDTSITNEKCSKCSILPVCMGGRCPYRIANNTALSCKEMEETFNYWMNNSFKSLNKKDIRKISI